MDIHRKKRMGRFEYPAAFPGMISPENETRPERMLAGARVAEANDRMSKRYPANADGGVA
jgi:hypothetical protein